MCRGKDHGGRRCKVDERTRAIATARRRINRTLALIEGTRNDPDRKQYLETRLAETHERLRAAKLIVDMSNEDNLAGARTIKFARHKVSAPQTGDTFGQDIEPAGRYMIERSDQASYPETDYDIGEITFTHPLHIEFGGGYSDPDNWKKVLTERYIGKSGRDLSQAIRDDGYDGIITFDNYGVSEIVDLTGFSPTIDSDVEGVSV